MGLQTSAIIDALASHAQSLGIFGSVQKHEPKSAPGMDLSYALYVSDVTPVAAVSGLDKTSARLEITGRIYRSFITDPQDLIDPELADAVDALMTAYVGNFTLGGLVRNIDIKGAHGQALRARAGYLSIGNKIFRVMDMVIPVIINDAWTETA